MSVPFFFHWYVGVGVPVAVTLKLALVPAVTVWLEGWVVMAGAVAVAALPTPATTLVLSVYVIANDAAPEEEADRTARLSVKRIAVVPDELARTLKVSSNSCFVPEVNVGNCPVRSSAALNPMMKDNLPDVRESKFAVIDAPPKSAPFALAEYSNTAGSNSTVNAIELTSPVVVARLIATCPVCPDATAKELFTTGTVTTRAG